MSLTASLKAIRQEAGVWQGVADVTGAAGRAAGRLTLTEAELSGAAAATGLVEAYQRIQQRVGDLLAEATTVYTDLGAALLAVAAAYEATDDMNARYIRATWEPVE